MLLIVYGNTHDDVIELQHSAERQKLEYYKFEIQYLV